MQKAALKLKEEHDSLKPVADALFTYLHDIIYKPSDAFLDTESLPEAFRNFGKGLQYFCTSVSQARAFAKELATGNLNCTQPPRYNEIASPLKALHASLKHLTWQSQQVAKGDYNQRVNFMGDFSQAFNNMIEKLDQQRKITLNEKTMLEMYVQLILEYCPNPILLFDSRGKLIFSSSSFSLYFDSVEIGNILGKNINELFEPYFSHDSLREIEDLYIISTAEKQILYTTQEYFSGSHESRGFLGIQMTPVRDSQGESSGTMVFLIDLTETINAQHEAERSRELAEQSSRSKSIFLAKMSHEIRTPMNAIIGMAELALRENIPPAAREQILTIKQAGSDLLSMINDIWNFSKIDAGDMEIVREEHEFSPSPSGDINAAGEVAAKAAKGFFINFTAQEAKVLIVDDIATNLQVARGLLLPYGMEITLCNSGPEAIEAVKAVRYDLIFMDHMMPEMDGVETVAYIRTLKDKDRYFEELPIVALSANAVSGTREMFLNNGFNDYLSKPIDTVKLDSILSKWIPKEKQIKSSVEILSGAEAEKISVGKNMEYRGLDTEKGIAMTGGDSKNYLKMLGVFYRDGIKKITEIQDCIESNNMSLYIIYVHGIKSALAIIGAQELSDRARALEMAGKQENQAFIQANTSEFLQELKKLLDHIDAILSEENSAAQDSSRDMNLLKKLLSELKTALDNFDSAVINKTADALQEFTHASDIGDAVKNILQYRLVGDYDGAAALIDSILQTSKNPPFHR
ncbi:MAG: response regulator [Treponema sp.]|nr:response regulator [Treponema sp.]